MNSHKTQINPYLTQSEVVQIITNHLIREGAMFLSGENNNYITQSEKRIRVYFMYSEEDYKEYMDVEEFVDMREDWTIYDFPFMYKSINKYEGIKSHFTEVRIEGLEIREKEIEEGNSYMLEFIHEERVIYEVSLLDRGHVSKGIKEYSLLSNHVDLIVQSIINRR